MSDNVANPPRWNIAPYFIVDDVVSSANYYRDKLGFQYKRFWGEPPCFCMVCRSGIVIMLKQLEKTGVMRPTESLTQREEPGTLTFGSKMQMRSMRNSRQNV
jgi:hypothetical protein